MVLCIVRVWRWSSIEKRCMRWRQEKAQAEAEAEAEAEELARL